MALLDYAGAGSRLDIALAAKLPWQKWAAMRKIDGAYCRVSTDRAGRIVSLLTRSGRPFSTADSDGLIGIPTGLPDAVLAGELTAHTEAGVAARQAAGFASLHLFDVSYCAGRSVATRPYSERYGLLHRGQVRAELAGRDESWHLDDHGAAHDLAGRYCAAVPRDTRRLPIVELHRGRGAIAAAYALVVADGGEGIVAVALDAPLARRGSKRKVKPVDSFDAVVVATSPTGIAVEWEGREFRVGTNRAPRVGATVEIMADGWYSGGLCPRFVRLVRVRADA